MGNWIEEYHMKFCIMTFVIENKALVVIWKIIMHLSIRSLEIEDFVYIPSEENPHINYHKLLTGPFDEELKAIEKQVRVTCRLRCPYFNTFV